MSALLHLAPAHTAAAKPGSCAVTGGAAGASGVHLLGLEGRYLAEAYSSSLPLAAGLEPALRGVLADVLEHPGNLVRAQLAYAVARAYGVEPEVARDIAIAVEYFHSASLVFDDLPSMDDATTRRGRECPHVTFGEGAATLGALAFVSRAYELLWQVLTTVGRKRSRRAAALVAECLGSRGVLNGQAWDLRGEARSEREVLAVAEGKTVSMIRLALGLAAATGKTKRKQRRQIDRLAHCWGLAYQVLDDFRDIVMTSVESGKSARRDELLGRPNMAVATGTDAAMSRLEQLLSDGRELVQACVAETKGLRILDAVQTRLESDAESIRERLAPSMPMGASAG